MAATQNRQFPISAGVLLGLGLGGFSDGIVFHQLLQWHHMLSTWHPATDVAALKLNTFADGIFHASTYALVVIGLVILWRAAHSNHLWWSGRMLTGSMLIGFGTFNLVEGTVDHQILGIHHVNETVPPGQWWVWDAAFLVWGAAMLIGGWMLCRSARRASPGEPDS
jgi:uncharacterized membrane protein